MELFFSFLAHAFLALIVHGAQENIPLSSQSPCTVDRVCGVLETILQRQDRLEKIMKEHGKILGDQRCTEGKDVV